MRQRAASHPVGLVSESYTRAVEDRADARHCGVSSMRAQAKNQIAQFLPNPGRRIPGGAIGNVGNICLRIRFRSSLAEVSPSVSVRKQMSMQLVTCVTLAHSQSDSVSCEVCQRLERSIVHSPDLVSLQMLVGSFVLDCWRGFVQDNMFPNRKNACDGGGACVATFGRTGWFLT